MIIGVKPTYLDDYLIWNILKIFLKKFHLKIKKIQIWPKKM
jgi:hypothetical protein